MDGRVEARRRVSVLAGAGQGKLGTRGARDRVSWGRGELGSRVSWGDEYGVRL